MQLGVCGLFTMLFESVLQNLVLKAMFSFSKKIPNPDTQ